MSEKLSYELLAQLAEGQAGGTNAMLASEIISLRKALNLARAWLPRYSGNLVMQRDLSEIESALPLPHNLLSSGLRMAQEKG